MTPDPAGKGAARLDDPQTWNLYAYVRNNPTTLTDPSGECWQCVAAVAVAYIAYKVGEVYYHGQEAAAKATTWQQDMDLVRKIATDPSKTTKVDLDDLAKRLPKKEAATDKAVINEGYRT